MKNPTSAGCYVIRENGNTYDLLLMYREWPNGAKGWLLPKGHIEEGESYEEAAIRETAEETGYRDLEILHDLGTETYINYADKKEKTIQWYLAKLKNNNQENLNLSKSEKESHIEIHWKTLEDSKKLLHFEKDRERIDEIKDYLTTQS